MTIRATVAGSIGGLLFLLAIARMSFAADQDATLQQMTSLNKGALAAYSAGDFDKCKTQLLQAVALGNKSTELQTHPLMARTYLHLGVLYVDGFEDRPAGVQYFAKALKIRSDIELTQALATVSAKSAFEEAKGAAKGAPAKAAAAGPGAKEAATKQPLAVAKDKEPANKEPPAAAKDNATKSAAPPANDKAEEKPAPKLSATDKRKAAEAAQRAAAEEKKKAAAEEKRAAAEARQAAIEEKKAAAEEKKKAAAEARQAAVDKKKAAVEEKKAAEEEKKKAAAEARQAALDKKKAAAEEKKKPAEPAKQATEPAKQAVVDEKRAATEKLQAEKADKEKQLAGTKAAVDQAQKDGKEKEKQAQAQAQADRDKLTKELAQLKDSEAKERTAKEKLQVEKADKEKQLAEAKIAIQQLQKEKAEQEKQLAENGIREKKEREAKEKLDKERLLAETHEKEHQAQLETERQEREKRAAGPDLPAHIPEPLYCAVPDEAQSATELFVHCVPRPDVKAKVIALYYRQSGAVHYNSLSMEPSKKGWHMAVIPADKVTGKVLQYYVEARDVRGGVVATTGKANSPNILTLRSTPVERPKTGAVAPPLAKAAGRAATRKSH